MPTSMRTRALARLASERTCFMTDCLTEEESMFEEGYAGGFGIGCFVMLSEWLTCLGSMGRKILEMEGLELQNDCG